MFVVNAQQKPKVEVSKPYPVVDATSKQYLKSEQNILALKDNTLQLLGTEKMNLASISEFELPKKAEIEKLCKINDKFVLFYSLWDKENEMEQLFYKYVKNGKLEGDGTLLIKVKGKISGDLAVGGFYSYRVVNKFNFQFSNKDSKLLIKYRIKPEERDDSKNNDIIGFNVFDSDLKKIWTKEVKMPYTEKKMDNLDYAVDGEGNVYILARIYNDESTKLEVDDKLNFHLEILRVEANSGTINKTPINLEDKFVYQLSLYECTSEYMICAGLTSKNIHFDADGLVVFKIMKDGALSEKSYYKIPLEVLNQYETERKQIKNEKKEEEDKSEFQNLLLQNLIVEADGSIILVGEQYYVTTHTTYSNGKSYTTYTYHYNDMLMTKIDKSGQLAWMKKLPKRQQGAAGQGSMSYKYMEGDGCHYLLFLDNVKNMHLELNKRPSTHADGKGGYLTAYKIQDSDGRTEKISILNIDDIKDIALYQFSVDRIIPITLNSFIFEAYKKQKEDVLVKVTFQ